MKLLLDTATFIWLVEGDAKPSESARASITDPAKEVFLSAASVWEIVVKHGLGRLVLRVPPEEYVLRQRRLRRVELLPIGRSGNPAGGQTAGPSSRSIRPNHRQASHFLGFGDCDRRPADQDLSHAGRVVMREARDGRSASSSLSAPPLKHQQPAWMGATRRSASRRQRRRQ